MDRTHASIELPIPKRNADSKDKFVEKSRNRGINMAKNRAIRLDESKVKLT